MITIFLLCPGDFPNCAQQIEGILINCCFNYEILVGTMDDVTSDFHSFLSGLTLSIHCNGISLMKASGLQSVADLRNAASREATGEWILHLQATEQLGIYLCKHLDDLLWLNSACQALSFTVRPDTEQFAAILSRSPIVPELTDQGVGLQYSEIRLHRRIRGLIWIESGKLNVLEGLITYTRLPAFAEWSILRSASAPPSLEGVT